MRKNSFFTFVLSCWPGAGQMYLGYTKRGASLMTAFMAVIGFCGFFDIWIVGVFLPVIWFYAFFDTWTIRGADAAWLAAHPDDFLLPSGWRHRAAGALPEQKYRRIFGIVLIVCGVYALYNSILMPALASLLNALPYDLNWLWRIFSSLPTLVAAVLVILLGVRLIRGGARPADDVVEFHGGEAQQ